jgi:hypothetical protein
MEPIRNVFIAGENEPLFFASCQLYRSLSQKSLAVDHLEQFLEILARVLLVAAADLGRSVRGGAEDFIAFCRAAFLPSHFANYTVVLDACCNGIHARKTRISCRDRVHRLGGMKTNPFSLQCFTGLLLLQAGAAAAANYLDVVLADGPIAYYRFNDVPPVATNNGSLGVAAKWLLHQRRDLPGRLGSLGSKPTTDKPGH